MGSSCESARLEIAQLRILLQGARELGLETGASGVEDEETLQRLRELGCGEAQGAVLDGKDWCAGGDSNPTPLLASGPKPGASTNFATRAVQALRVQGGHRQRKP